MNDVLPVYTNQTIVEYQPRDYEPEYYKFKVAVCEDFGISFSGTVISGTIHNIGKFGNGWTKKLFKIIEPDPFKELFIELDKLEKTHE